MKYWERGFRIYKANNSETNPWTESNILIQEVQAIVDIITRNLRIQEYIDIQNFIYIPEE